MKDERIYELRRRRLAELIQTRFGGKQSLFAEKIERSPNYVSFDEIRDAPIEQLGLELTPTAKQLARDFDELPELAQIFVAEVIANVKTLMRKNPALAKVMFSPPDQKAHARAMKRIVEYQAAHRVAPTPPDDND